MCSLNNKLIMGLTTWMKKRVVFVQILIKRVSMKGTVMGGFFFKEGMCWRSSTAVGFCNGVEHVGPCSNFGRVISR